MRIGRTTIVVFISKATAAGLGFLTTIYFARILGAEIIGYYSIVIAIVSWLKIGGLGISDAMTKRMSERKEPGEYLTATAVSMTVLGGILSCVILLLEKYINAYIGVPVAAILVVVFLVASFDSFTKASLRGDHLVHINGLLSPARIGFRSILQLILVFEGLELIGLLTGYIVGGILISLLGLKFLSTKFSRPQKRHFKNLFDYAKFAWLSGIKTRAHNDVDILILTIFVQPALVGVYSVAWSITKFITIFERALSDTLFPKISEADSEGNSEVISSLINSSLTYGGFIAIPGLFGGALLSERLLQIYGSEFTQGADVLVLLILASLLYGYKSQLINAVNAVDRPDIAFKINSVFIFSNITLNIILISAFGFVGAAIATAVSAGLGMVLSLVALERLITYRFPIKEISKQFVSAGIMALVVDYGLMIYEKNAITNNALIVFSLAICGAILYGLVLFIISKQFRSTVLKNSPIQLFDYLTPR